MAEHEPCVLNTMHLKNPITADSFKIHAPAGAKKVKALVLSLIHISAALFCTVLLRTALEGLSSKLALGKGPLCFVPGFAT